MPVFTDQTGRKLSLTKVPQRIISVVPSQTELLYDLGLNKEIVGITKFCIHPKAWFEMKTRIGGTKQLKQDIINSLKPDLIIANKEENLKEQIEELEKDYPVWISDISGLNDAYEMIRSIGQLTGKKEAAEKLIDRIKTNFSQLLPFNFEFRTCYLIWQNPYMTVGGDTFINSILEIAGFKNMYINASRYPEITIAGLSVTNCELLLLPSEPFPFKQKHIDELQPLLPNTKIILVDGEMFSWYGSRLLQVPDYLIQLQIKIQNIKN